MFCFSWEPDAATACCCPCCACCCPVPLYRVPAQTEELLYTMMAGAAEVLTEAGATIVGGHTCEGEELSLGFSITGVGKRDECMVKGGLQAGQALLLTKPLGTGTIMAAAMRGRAKGRWVAGALRSMQQASGAAAAILRAHGAAGCTDVTGFGLVGHLVEMVRPSGVHVALDFSALPLLDGAAECMAAGILSSLHVQNAKAAASIQNLNELQAAHATWPILMDPQTAGGLLAGVPAERADAALQALRAAGYSRACVIGRVVEVPAAEVCAPLRFVLSSSTGNSGSSVPQRAGLPAPAPAG